METTTKIVQFFNNELRIGELGGTFEEILKWSDDRWDASHDFIQWVFPLTEPSNFNSAAPLLTPEEIRSHAALLSFQVHRAAVRFLQFLGLKIQGVDATEFVVVAADNFSDREHLWTDSNHNWLRITRCLHCLKLLSADRNIEKLLVRFYDVLLLLFNDGYGTENSLKYWTKAATVKTNRFDITIT